jgi:hypothetical protein
MQLLRFSALKCVRLASVSGISEKRLPERSNDCKVLATGARLLAINDVRPFSARLKCRRNAHFDDGRIPMANKSDVLCRGVISAWLEPELPLDLRYLGVAIAFDCAFCEEVCRDVVGRGGELLGRLLEGFLLSAETSLLRAVELPNDARRTIPKGEFGTDVDRASSGCLYLGLPFGQSGIPGVDGVVGT